MKLIIHDLDEQEFMAWYPQMGTDTVVISDNGTIHNCIGCFGCWLKTPGTCVLKDGYDRMGELLSQSEEVIIISKCIYGSYSPFVRNVLDRCLPYLLPYFALINGETHHRNRYEHTAALSVHFYGDSITAAERQTAAELVKANGINFYTSLPEVCFYQDAAMVKEALA